MDGSPLSLLFPTSPLFLTPQRVICYNHLSEWWRGERKREKAKKVTNHFSSLSHFSLTNRQYVHVYEVYVVHSIATSDCTVKKRKNERNLIIQIFYFFPSLSPLYFSPHYNEYSAYFMVVSRNRRGKVRGKEKRKTIIFRKIFYSISLVYTSHPPPSTPSLSIFLSLRKARLSIE